jgi:hypothetical protein
MIPRRFARCHLLKALALVGVAALALQVSRESSAVKADTTKPAVIDFARQIRPILSDNCFACHGPDDKARKARFRLDTKANAFGELRGGGRAIMPGKPAESELLARIRSGDPSELMPPPMSNKKLTEHEKELFRQWIEQGAPWTEHWAFVPPKRPALPKVKEQSWPRNPIDGFILARLQKEHLAPSPEAPRPMLIRRVSLDLTGLPPTPAEVDAFLADQAPDAYEKMVDRLLRSPRYGEHMARFWLDAARYGDTHGMHLDNYREMWPYRDWVIKAFNTNLPYDRFLIDQLAGDLLPNPSLDDLIATGFNRCHVSTNEGGSINEEVYVRNVVDRVDTNGVVFLGLTVGCARCHDHRYDPIRMKDYYQLFAFFNSLDGPAMDGNIPRPAPFARVAAPAQAAALARVEQIITPLRKQIAEALAKVMYDDSADATAAEQLPRGEYVWIDDDLPAGAKAEAGGGINHPWNFVAPPAPVHSGAKSAKLSTEGLGQFVLQGAKPGLRVGKDDVLFAYVYLDPNNPPREIMLQWNTGNWLHRAYWGDNLIPWGNDNSSQRLKAGALPAAGSWVRLEVSAARVGIKPGTMISGWAFTQHGGTVYWDRAGLVTQTPQSDQAYDTLSAWVAAQRATNGAGLPKPLQDLIKVERGKRSDAQKKHLRDYFLEHAYSKARTTFAPLNQQLTRLEKERDQLDKQIPTTLIFKESSQPQPAYILKRGEYDRRGDVVGRDTPAFLPPLPAGAPRNRLGFAQWLVAPNHPLTARVAVNRFWQQCFGTGLVKTAEDFGSQGEPPSHPELLDWLAVQFREDGWDVKKTIKRIVTSAAYRQSSHVSRDRLAKDSANRLLSRGPRYRLDAEMLRDQALALGGLLAEHLGGPSVKPPQPPGLWEAVAFTGSNTGKFTADAGLEKLHRRSLYTFWKRTAHPPQMGTLDAPSRETCIVRRERTNTPLQALLMMNERQFVEAARALAERTMREGGAKVETRLAYLFKLATARAPDPQEMAELTAAFSDHLATFRKDEKSARRLIAVGDVPPNPAMNPSELAAWTMMANLVLNLDEVINKG